MCTLVILRRPGHAWPLVLAANRDELRSRPARPPARHWPDRAHVVAGLDELAGGTWLGVNDDGMAAAVLNRHGSLGPQDGKRSRGELVLDALDHAEAYIAADALLGLEPSAYRPFNLVLADAVDAFLLTNVGDGTIRALPIPEGVSLLEAGELNDAFLPRTARYLPRFSEAPLPEPPESWGGWRDLLADRGEEGADPRAAMCIVTGGEYGTVSGSLLALPAYAGERPVWSYADGRPGEAPWAPVEV